MALFCHCIVFNKFTVKTAPVKRGICGLHWCPCKFFPCKFLTSFFFSFFYVLNLSVLRHAWGELWVKRCNRYYVCAFLIFLIPLALGDLVSTHDILQVPTVAVLALIQWKHMHVVKYFPNITILASQHSRNTWKVVPTPFMTDIKASVSGASIDLLKCPGAVWLSC